MSNYLSDNVCEAVARDFFEGAQSFGDLVSEGEDGSYQINGDLISVRCADAESGDRIIGMPAADFVGGVTYALAQNGGILAETANSRNVANICFLLGRLTASGVGQ